MMISKTISIKEYQQKWLVDNDKNLSKFVQRRIDEEMTKETMDDFV